MQQDILFSTPFIRFVPTESAPVKSGALFSFGGRVEIITPGDLSTYERGVWAEAVAIRWLECERYRVYLNVTAVGPYDMVVFKGGEFTGIDVKLMSIRVCDGRMSFSDRSGAKTKAQQGLSVKFLYVTEEGICSFNRAELRNSERVKRGMDVSRYKRGRPRKELAELLALAPLKSLE